MKHLKIITVVILICGLQVNAHAVEPEAETALGIPFRLNELSVQQQETGDAVEVLKVEQQTTTNTLDNLTLDLDNLHSKVLNLEQSIAGAPAICDRTCEHGILNIHFTQTDSNGSVLCPSAPSLLIHCDPYKCDQDGTSCLKICQDNSDCQFGSACCTDLGCLFADALVQCVPDVLHCDGQNTLFAPDGETIDCTPYECRGSSCLSRCTSTADCAAGAGCDSQERCVFN